MLRPLVRKTRWLFPANLAAAKAREDVMLLGGIAACFLKERERERTKIAARSNAKEFGHKRAAPK